MIPRRDPRGLDPEVLVSRGRVVALLGPDGCGKSAVIQEMRTRLAERGLSTRTFHLRPHFGRSEIHCGPETDPHGRESRGPLLSLAKLLLWSLDFTIGYAASVYPGISRGEIVLFDRYFHDLLVDPLRYRFGASLRLADWVFRRLPAPDLTIVLDAPVDVLLARKREVRREEVERQRGVYRRLAGHWRNSCIVDASRPLDRVVDEVEDRVFYARRDSVSGHGGNRGGDVA